jgi:Protein of unknown function (DUF3467)
LPMKRLKSVSETNERTGNESDSVVAAIYVNYFELGHNPFEFLVDFGQFHPGLAEGDGATAIHSRIALAPPYAKMLSDLLARSVREHEIEYGPIAVVGAPASPLDSVLSPFGDFEERARALRSQRVAPVSTPSFNDR